MNLKELNSFKLSDAVTFHDKLNPKLWNGTKLRPEVREQLLKIAEDFLQELGVNDLDVKDITISGSNAAFSYTKYSDLDLHILVDMGNLPADEVYRELFLAKKTIYNDTHDIRIHTIPVELYVQDSRQPVVSLGEYSVMNDQWIKIPTKRRSDFDQTATKSKYEKLLSLIEIALKSKKYSKVKHIIDTIKRYRQAGLDKGGEFGPENLAYKMLRSQGYITKLYDLRDKLHSEILTVETMYQNIDEDEGKENNNTAISLSKLGKFHPGADALAEFVPERASAQYALHPDKWESTFYSLTNKDSDKLRYYGPKKISIPPGTLVGDMAIANKFYRAKTSEEKQQYAEAYKASLQSYPVDVSQYRMPELLIPRQNVDEAFDTPLPITWEKGMHGDVDALAKLPDGTNLSIMFNKQDNIKPDDKTWMVEFYRNNSQEVTGEGDAQKVFSTVLTAIQQFIKKYKPLKIYFSASKEMDPTINYGPDDVVPNPESRAKLYDRMVLRYAKSWGYKFFRADNGSSVIYQLSRIPKQTAVGENQTMQFAAEKIPVVSPYAGIKDNQYRGSISEVVDNDFLHSIEAGSDQTVEMNGYSFRVKNSTNLAGRQHRPGIVVNVYDNKNLIGWADFILYQDKKDAWLESHDTEVVEKYQNKGIATMMYAVVKSLGFDIKPSRDQSTAGKNMWRKWGKDADHLVSEASGYIPSEKQKNDPRYSTALTVDVHPDSIKKNAKAFYWNTSRAGIPPTAKANGKI